MSPSPAKKSKSTVDTTDSINIKKIKSNEDIVCSTSEVKIKPMKVEDMYVMEDELAAERGTVSMGSQLVNESSKLRKILESIVNGESPSIDMKEALLSSIIIKRNSRLCYYANAALKKELTTRMEIVESKYMQLQNISSEIDHLRKEIDRCLQYPSDDERIPLISVDEFYEKAKKEISLPEITIKDVHQQKVARLNYEREERKELVSTLSELEFRRSVLMSDINKKESRVKSLKPKIESLIKSTRSIGDILGIPSTSSSSSSSHRHSPSFNLLPPQLSVIYIQAQAYKELIEDSGVSITISGDCNEAKRLSDDKKKEGDDEDEEMIQDNVKEEEDKDSRDKVTVSEALEKKRNDILKPHPIHLSIEIGCVDDIRVRMKIQYLCELGISMVKWKVKGSLPSFGSICDSDTVMDELLIDDDGMECPNAIGSAKLSQLKVSLSSLTHKLGRPYKFIQKLTGSPDEGNGTILADILQQLIECIRRRIENRIDLTRLLINIHNGGCDDLFKREGLELIENVYIKDVKMITEEEFASIAPSSSHILIKNECSSPFAYLIFTIHSNNTKIRILSCIWSQFPIISPLWFVLLNEGVDTISSDNNVLLKEIENKLNDKNEDNSKIGMVSLLYGVIQSVQDIKM